MLGEGFFAGVKFATERTFVFLLPKGNVAGVLLFVKGQVGLSGVALKTDVTLEWFLTCVHSGVTLILPCGSMQQWIFRLRVHKVSKYFLGLCLY